MTSDFEFGTGRFTQREIAAVFGISHQAVSNIVLGKLSGVNYFSRSTTIILPASDNYKLCKSAFLSYTDSDRGRG